MPPFSQPGFEIQGSDFLLDGAPFRIFSGELHYFRIPRAYWAHRLACARAMGLNTISTYLPWNLHEPVPGQFDFADNLDIETFLGLADEAGLKVIVRPGPYICAEWDLGGLPPWLLAIPDLKVRCLDPRFLEAVGRYFAEVGRRLAPLQRHRGGPVILVQVENEYGAFGNDRAYMDAMVALVRRVGFDGALYTCDWAQPANLKAGEVGGAVTVANFGTRAAEQIGLLRQLRPGQPSMCGEFWAGWFDAWGEPRKGSADPAPVVAELKWMLENDCSFNFYMVHGGTSFGLMAGANHYASWAPTVSSYDYWAPLDEAGRPTEKYFALRDLLARFQPGPLPEVPSPPLPIVGLGPFVPSESAALLDNLPAPVRLAQPQPMEALGQSYGLVLYRTDIGGLGDQELEVVEAHDFATVWVNGRPSGNLDRRRHETKLRLTGVPKDRAILDILVDTMGRTNFGPKLLDRKGITDRVTYGELTLMGWEAYSIPLDGPYLASLKWAAADHAGPAFHRAWVEVDVVGDTFLDLGAYSRGVVWVNGRCLSRFWNVGPQQTCYLPGAWLKPGPNEIVVFDAEGQGRAPLEGLKAPLLDRTSRLLAEALASATETEVLLSKDGALAQTGVLFREKFPGKPALIIGAADTWGPAGAAVEASLKAAGVRLEPALLFPVEPFLHADYEVIVQIRERLKACDAIPVSVGSGTVNDLVKRAAFEVGRRYVCVATATSVDGFTSSGAAILKDGFKQTLACPAPLVVVADPAVLCSAPGYLTSSGYGDLASKIIAGADWLLADAVGADPVNPFAFRLTQTELRQRLATPAQSQAGDPSAILGLFDGLAMTGFAMQFMKSSRPVSGCEHLFSHVWEMEDLHFGGRPVTHGHKVAIGTLIATAFYEVLLSRGIEGLDPVRAIVGRPSSAGREAFVRGQFQGSPAAEGAVAAAVTMAVGKLDPAVAQKRLALFLAAWPGLQAKLRTQLVPYQSLKESFALAGCPIRASDIGLSRDYAIRTAYRAQCIRDRYSVLDLMFDAGILDECVDRVLADRRYL